MAITLKTTLVWIPVECGGRSTPPNIGLRPTIRFQRNAEKWTKIAWDVQIAALELISQSGVWTVELRFSEDASLDMECIKTGELIELLDAYRVIGVGKVTGVETGSPSLRR